MLATTRY